MFHGVIILNLRFSVHSSNGWLCRRDYHEELAALMLYMVKEGHLDTARDIVLVMLVNMCVSDHFSMRSLMAGICQGCERLPNVHHQASCSGIDERAFACVSLMHYLA